MSTTEPTMAQLAALQASSDEGPVVMLNLLRCHDDAHGIDAADGITGAQAYARYGAGVTRLLERAGGRVLLADPEYLAVHGHRAAGVADSRLVACTTLTA